jgi:hypothetical protein
MRVVSLSREDEGGDLLTKMVSIIPNNVRVIARDPEEKV